MRRAQLALGTALLLVLSETGAGRPASAQEGGGTLAGAGAAVLLNAISVTATGNPRRAFEVPGMVTVVDRESLQRFQPSTVDDALRGIPNLEFVGGPRRNGETPSIRGFSGADVIVTLDGARQNFGSAHDGRFFVDPSLLGEAEVLRGQASALYGSGGNGGVIALRTLDARDLLAPGETYGASLGLGGRSANTERLATLTAFGRPQDNLDLLGSLTKRDSGSIDLGDGNTLYDSDDDIVSGMVKGGFEFKRHHRLEGGIVYYNNDAREPNNAQDPNGNDLADKDIKSKTYRAAYSYSDPKNRLIDLEVQAYYSDFVADELRLDGNGAGPVGELLKRNVDTIGTRIENRSRAAFGETTDVTFTYGLEAYRDRQDGAAGAGERDGVPDAAANYLGGFAQAELDLAEPFGLPGNLLIVPGLRFDDYRLSSQLASANHDSAVSPRIGASYLPTDWLLLFANYGHAFRAPTFDELYLTGVHFTIPIGPGITNRFVTNPDLKPQRTRSLEFGAGLQFEDLLTQGDGLQLKASHFITKGEDFIDLSVNQPSPFVDCNPFIPGNCDGTTTSANVANAKLRGTEVEGSYETDRILLSLGFSTIDGENEDSGAKLGTLTPTQVTLGAVLKLPEIESSIGLRSVLAKDFDKVNSEDERRDGYDVHDLVFSYAPKEGPLDGFRLDLGISNAFDENYARVYTGAAEEGRSFNAYVGYSLTW